MMRRSSSCCRSALRRLACTAVATTLPVISETMPEKRSLTGPGPPAAGRSPAAARSRTARLPAAQATAARRRFGAPSAFRKSAMRARLSASSRPLTSTVSHSQLRPPGWRGVEGGVQHDQVDVRVLGGLEQVLEQQAPLRPAGGLHIKQLALDAARDQQRLAGHRSHGGRQARRDRSRRSARACSPCRCAATPTGSTARPAPAPARARWPCRAGAPAARRPRRTAAGRSSRSRDWDALRRTGARSSPSVRRRTR